MRCGKFLGFNDERVLIFHADDAGDDPFINEAIYDTLNRGIVQSCSVLIKGYPDKFLFKIRDYDYDVGLHFFATSDNPSRQVDEQFKYMVKKGVYPTHIDSHCGSFFVIPEVARACTNYAAAKDIPIVVPDVKPSTIRRFRSFGLHLQGFKGYNGVRIDDMYVLSMLGGESYEEKKLRFLGLLQTIKPGVTQIILHMTSNPDWKKWYWEWELFKDPDVIQALQPFTITNWKEIWKRWKHQ